MKYCRICGAIMKDEDIFCARCGTRQEGVGINSVGREIENPFEKKPKKADLQDYKDRTEVTSDNTSSGRWNEYRDRQGSPESEDSGRYEPYRQSGSWDGRKASGGGNIGGQAPQNTPDDGGGIIWLLLGLILPFVGLILFLAWKNKKPRSARKAMIGAFIGIIIGSALRLTTDFSFLPRLWDREDQDTEETYEEQDADDADELFEDSDDEEGAADEEIPAPDIDEILEEIEEQEGSDLFSSSATEDIDDLPMIGAEPEADGSYVLTADPGREFRILFPEGMEAFYSGDQMIAAASDMSSDVGMSSFYYIYDDVVTDEVRKDFMEPMLESDEIRDPVPDASGEYSIDGHRVTYSTMHYTTDVSTEGEACILVEAEDCALVIYVYKTGPDTEDVKIGEDLVKSITDGIRISG